MPDAGDEPRDTTVLVETASGDIARGSMTITQFLGQRGVSAVPVELESSGDSAGLTAASAVLVARDGRKYDVGALVARGGMGVVLSAKDLNIRRPVAMKVMLRATAGKHAHKSIVFS